MLAVLTTDADVSPDNLQSALSSAVSTTFNRIVVDGCTSTNDTVLVLANGQSGAPDPSAFASAQLTSAVFVPAPIARSRTFIERCHAHQLALTSGELEPQPDSLHQGAFSFAIS
jgi:hypothetical protein